MKMAMTLANYLDAIERGQMPDDLSEDAEAIEWLDERDCDQYAKLLDGLRRLLNQGSISRVIWGMAVVCDPANKCIDPSADTIEHHPDLVKAAEQRDELLAALIELNSVSAHGFLYDDPARVKARAAIAKVQP